MASFQALLDDDMDGTFFSEEVTTHSAPLNIISTFDLVFGESLEPAAAQSAWV